MTTEVPCRICGNQTPMLGTKLCDRCWELESRIKHDPELARKILKAFDETSVVDRMKEDCVESD
jgi:hypothetical protein